MTCTRKHCFRQRALKNIEKNLLQQKVMQESKMAKPGEFPKVMSDCKESVVDSEKWAEKIQELIEMARL